MMKGLNDDEICDFAALTENKVLMLLVLNPSEVTGNLILCT